MKIRLSSQEIRLRLTKDNMQELGQKQQLECTIRCAGRNWGYRLKLVESEQLQLIWNADILQILLPNRLFRHFAIAGRDAVMSCQEIIIDKSYNKL